MRICDYPGKWAMKHEYLIEAKRQIAHIAVGSTVEHAAHTVLGSEMDGKTICILAYMLHAAMIEKLGSTVPILAGM